MCLMCQQILPLTVLQSGLSMTCATDVTKRVESRPLVPCTKTEAPSWSKHWATRQAALRAFCTYVSQLLFSRRDNHLSDEQLESLHAKNILHCDKSTYNVHKKLTKTPRIPFKRRDQQLR